jgi:hypothetical protein
MSTRVFLTERGRFGGQLEAESWEEAELLAANLGVTVVGELVEEIPSSQDEVERIKRGLSSMERP